MEVSRLSGVPSPNQRVRVNPRAGVIACSPLKPTYVPGPYRPAINPNRFTKPLHPLLIVTVSPIPRVKLISWPTSQVSINGESFEDAGAGDTNGFYDFLRLPQRRIVGVRFTPFVEHSLICGSAAQGQGLRVTGTAPTASVELLWGGDHAYSEALSTDQFMDYNYIFKSPQQTYAVTFGFSHLEESEINDLLSGLPQSNT